MASNYVKGGSVAHLVFNVVGIKLANDRELIRMIECIELWS